MDLKQKIIFFYFCENFILCGGYALITSVVGSGAWFAMYIRKVALEISSLWWVCCHSSVGTTVSLGHTTELCLRTFTYKLCIEGSGLYLKKRKFDGYTVASLLDVMYFVVTL